MGDPRTQKGGLWVVIGVLCCVGGFLLWMFIQKIAGCTPPRYSEHRGVKLPPTVVKMTLAPLP